MRSNWQLLVLILLLAGCSKGPEAPMSVCFEKRPASKQLSAVEKKALDESRRRSVDECSRTDTQCGFGVLTEPGGEIGVMVQFANVTESGECSYAVGYFHTDKYDEHGSFAGTIPGL